MAPYDQAHATEAANFIKKQSPHHLVSGTGSASTLLFIYGRSIRLLNSVKESHVIVIKK
jgi:hypothetical protein